MKFVPFFILLLISFGVYFNALSGDFVYDDEAQVVENPWIRNFGDIPTIFSKDVWSFESTTTSTNYYRPLMHFVYMIDYHIFGLKPWGFHLVNILFHCGVSVLVFLLIRRLISGQEAPVSPVYLSPAFIASLLFALHPVHTEPVAWIAGLPDVAFTFFYLLSFYFYTRSKAAMSGSHLFSIICFAVAAFFKEPALTLPVIFLAWDYGFREGRISFRDYIKNYVPYLAVAAVYLAARIYALGGFAPNVRHATLSAFQCVINVFPLFMQYLLKLLLPVNLNAFYVFRPISSPVELRGIISLLAVTAFAALFLSLRKNRAAFLGFLFIALPLLPSLYIPALGENTFSERYLYLPSFGFVLLLVVFLLWTNEKLPGAARSITVVFVIIAALYAAGTINRNDVWKDAITLFSDTLKKSPDSAEVHTNLGLAYSSMGRPDWAVPEYEAALRLKPYLAETHNNLGLAYRLLGRLDEAIAEYQTALRLKPDFPKAHNDLGAAYERQGRLDLAIPEFQQALRLKPDSAEAHNNLGIAYATQGRLDAAIPEFQAALGLNPDLAQTHNNLGFIYASEGRIDRAVSEYQAALKLKPDFAEAHNNLGLAYKLQGRLNEAVAEFQTALQLRPDYNEARQHLNDVVSGQH